MNQPWYKTLAEKIQQDPELAAKLKSALPDSTFKEFRNGKPRLVEKMHKFRRAMLYELTHIEELRPEGYQPNTQTAPQEVRSEVSTETPSRNYSGLDAIAEKVDILNQEIRRLGASYDPSLKQRINAVSGSMKTLYDQLTYFASETTPQNERVVLADSVDPVAFGLIWNVLDGILKDPKSPEVFARAALSKGFGRPK